MDSRSGSNGDSRIYYTTTVLGSPTSSQTTSYNEAEVVLPDGTHRAFRAPGPTLPTATPITFDPPTGHNDTLVRNPDGSWDLTVQHSLSVYHFDPTGRLETMTDDFGNRLRLTYDGLGRIQRVVQMGSSIGPRVPMCPCAPVPMRSMINSRMFTIRV